MGEDKAFIEVGGVPLWRRQLQILQELRPQELFIAGPPHEEWQATSFIIIPDAEAGAGPLAGLVAALLRCSAPLLLTIAIDLPQIQAGYLRELLGCCSEQRGVVPSHGERFEPLAAVYPKCALPLAEICLASRDLSVQRFAARCLHEGFAIGKEITPEQRPLFHNMNTPEDVAALTNA
jgi:molybdenum cofactor guanylyltransferase